MLFIGMSSLSAKPDQKLTIRNHTGTLSELFKEIEKQSNYRFFYNDELVNIEKKVYQLDVNNKTVDEVLTFLLANTGLKYKKLENNLIVISTSELLENVNVTGSVTDAAGEPVIGVNVVVKGTTIGTTTDADGNFTLNIPNSDAVLVFSYIGYATQEIRVGAQRSFRIVLQENNLVLDEVVVIAYGTTKKKDLTGAISTVDSKSITAQSNSSVSRALEGAVAGLQVSATEGQPGVDMKIRVRGLGSTNEASSYALVVIDGVPAQIDNALTTINPNDIASVTVLKDAASTALYGSRGANGVVLVTTKKGASGKTKITADARWGMNTMTNNMPDLMRDPAAIYEHMWLLNYNTYRYGNGEPYQNNGYKNFVQNPLHTHEEAALFASQHLFNYTGKSITRNELGNWMLYEFPGWNDPSNYEITGDPGTATQSATMLRDFLVGTDGKLNPNANLRYNDTYYDQLLQSRFRQEYNIAAGGGNDKVDYHISLGLLEDPSYLSVSQFDRYTGRAVVNGKVTDRFKAGANVSYSYRRTSGQTSRYGTGTGTGLYQNRGDAQENIFSIVNGILPIVQMYARDEKGNYILNADGSRKVTTADGDSYSPLGPTSIGGAGSNLLYRMENDKAEVLSHDLTARTYVEAKFLQDFTFTANLATDATFSSATNYRNGETGRASAYGGALYRQNGTYVNLNTQQLLNWNRDFGKHHADALLGHEYNQYSLEVMRYTSTHELIPGYTGYINFVGRYAGNIGYPNPGGDISKLTMESYFARANYIYDDKYGVSASLRRDGSSKFKYTEDRWGIFWSMGGSWRLSNEKFMQATAGWLNNLKFRASYGVIGNQNGINTYGGYQTWSYGAVYQTKSDGTGVPASYTVSPGGFVNEHLTWENVHTTDIGVDFDLFNRVHGTFDWYNRETVNAFYANAVSIAAEAYAGTTSITMDNAKIRNRGFEVELNVDILRSKDIYWSIGANGTHYNTILTKLPSGQGSDNFGGNTVSNSDYLCYLRGVGKPYYNVFMYKYEGPDPQMGVPLYRHTVTQDDKPRMNDAGELVGIDHFPDNKVGDVVKTANYTRVTALDRVEFGDALPDWIGGFNTTFRYKNIDFSGVLSYQIGGLYHHREMIYFYESDFGRDRAMPIAADLIGNTWTPDNPNAKFPIAMHNKSNAPANGIAVAGTGPQQTTNLTLFGASYFSVKNITLGYSLPVARANRAGLSRLRIYVSADNLYMWSEYKGIDPRMSLTGGNDVSQFTYPYLRVFNLGVNIEF
jgi:TonB-linked SusC/RagA family outer membrane protein